MHKYATTQIILFQFLFPVYLKLKYASTSAPIPADVDMSSHVISSADKNRFCIHKHTPLLGKERGDRVQHPFSR